MSWHLLVAHATVSGFPGRNMQLIEQPGVSTCELNRALYSLQGQLVTTQHLIVLRADVES